MTRPNDGKDRELPTIPSEAEKLAGALDETELDETQHNGTEADPWLERFELSVPDRRDIDGELLEGRMLAELFGGERPEVAIGQYLIEQRLGHGGMGEVYAGRDVLAGHEVAIKLLRPTDDNKLDRQRLISEARALAKVKHQNVIALYHVGEHEGRLFIAMERIHGQTLAQWQASQPRLRALLQVYAAAARGLAAAHQAGVVHGDFKPSNVLLADDGRVLVSDFGVASVSDELGDKSSSEDRTNRGGTLLYLAPERAAGEHGDHKSDQFSFFTSLFSAIYGVGPVPGSSRGELLLNLCEGKLVLAPKTKRRVPSWLARVFERGLSFDPRRRFASMDEVAALLERRVSRKRIYAAGSVTAAALLLAIGRVTAPAAPPEIAPLEVDPIGHVWSAEQRHAIESDPNLGGPQLVAELDQWVDDWRRAYGSEDPKTRRCLFGALDRFDVLVGRVLEGRATRRAAFHTAAGLPDPMVCINDPAAPPEHLGDDERMAIAREITDAEFARHELRFDEAQSLARSALERAKQAEWLGGQLDALEQLGLALADKHARTEAFTYLQEARQLAVRSRLLERAAELGVALALVLPSEMDEVQRAGALEWTDLAIGIKAGPRLQVQLAIAHANEQMRQRDFGAAEQTLANAIAKYGLDRLPPYLEIKLRRRHADAIAEQGLARKDDAERTYQQASERARARLGDRYDALEETVLWTNMGIAAYEAGRNEEAKLLLEEALEQRSKLLTDDDPRIAKSLISLGYVDIGLYDYDAALARAEQALAIVADRSQALVSEAHGVAAMAYAGKKERAAALAAIDRSIAALPEGQATPELAIQRALILTTLDRGDEAIATFERDLQRFESGPKSADAASKLVGVWVDWLKLLRGQKKADLATREFERIRAHFDIEDADLERLENTLR